MTDNPIDAEHYFRRAYTIATAALPPDHPFVTTSRKNLHDFCAARGRPAELPPSPPAVSAWLDAPPPPAPPSEPPRPAKKQEVTPIARRRFLNPLALGALSGVALLIVILTMAGPWSGSVNKTTQAPPATAIAPALETPAPAPPATPAEPLAQPQPTAKPARNEVDAIAARPRTSEKSAATPTVVLARVCTALTNWRCKAAEGQAPPGPMFFYTKVKSGTATTIEHRWYQGDRMHRTAKLRIEANPGDGYRTYSRTTIGSDRAGDWRVEVRSADGTVLHEERFTVR